MFRCVNGCGRPVGRGEPLGGDLLMCARCAAAMNADLGYKAYRVDPETIYRQMARPEAILYKPRPVVGLVPMPPPRPRRRGWFW